MTEQLAQCAKGNSPKDLKPLPTGLIHSSCPRAITTKWAAAIVQVSNEHPMPPHISTQKKSVAMAIATTKW